MNPQNLIPESEALTVTGVSSSTLNRFAEAGYLQVESDTTGGRLFSRDELEALFGFKEPEEEEPLETQIYETETFTPNPIEEITFEDTPTSVPRVDEASVETPFVQAPEEPRAPEPKPKRRSSDREIERLKNLNTLQEKLLDLKEKEVADLKEQRDWLKSQVEKLQEKSDRDQLILVSVTETNRGLVGALEKRKSPVRAALEWFGVIPEEKVSKSLPGTTIEVKD